MSAPTRERTGDGARTTGDAPGMSESVRAEADAAGDAPGVAALPEAVRPLAADVAAELTGITRLGVAYSGGVDSATLLALAARVLGTGNVVALLGVSPSLARREHRLARRTAEQIGVEVLEIETAEMENPDYAKNDAARCFHCKDELFTRIDEDVVGAQRLDAVAYGENADDAARHDRPGAGAATRHRVLRPLAAAGATKAQVRELARALGLAVADKPAAPCLASRVPFGQAVTPEKLRQIDELEDAVFAEGFSDCRVRHHGEVARIEVPSEELPRAVEPAVRAALARAGKAAGFAHVTLDLDGIRSGLFALQIVRRGDSGTRDA